MDLILILGNHLFAPDRLARHLKPGPNVIVFMREDRGLCTHYRYHKHKLIFFLAAMRAQVEELRDFGYTVHYEELGTNPGPYEDALFKFVTKHKVTHVHTFEIEDKFFESRLNLRAASAGLPLMIWNTPMFLTTRQEFQQYLAKARKPFMKTFYSRQRQRFKILLDPDGGPIGGQWSFDEQNRKSLPKGKIPPRIPQVRVSAKTREVVTLVNREFADHPGASDNFWLPVERADVRKWFTTFLRERFHEFGPYEDALSPEAPFIYHSVLTPFLNVGLITPQEVVATALKFADKEEIPLNSCEGFIRQVIGWREFIRGIYQNFSEEQESKNFWNHQGRMTQHWWDGTTGIEPLDDVIKKVQHYGYAHHIERLMVVGSLMQLLEVHPSDAHRWFMEMFVDSSDWVMGPNVYGMGIFSDGGIFATKPYICASNYYKKMGPYRAGDWQDGVDGLYWSFIEKHGEFYRTQGRSPMILSALAKIPAERKARIYTAAADLKRKLIR